MNSSNETNAVSEIVTIWCWPWYCMSKSEVAEKYATVEFRVETGLHHGSDLTRFLFAMVMDSLLNEVREEHHSSVMFANI